MTLLDWIIVVLAVAALPWLAVQAGRRIARPDDYFTGGQQSGLFQLVMFVFGSGTCPDSTSTVMASAWRTGLSGLWWQFLWLPITPIYWVLAPVLRRLRAVTTADFFFARFGPSTAILYSLYGMVICVVMMAGVLWGSARLLNVLTDPLCTEISESLNLRFPVISLQTALHGPAFGHQPLITWRPLLGDAVAGIFLSMLLLVCGLIGGLNAGIVIDCIQGCVRIFLTVVLLPVVFYQIGGFGSLQNLQYLKPGMLEFVASSDARLERLQEPFTPFYLCVLSIAALLGIVVQPHIVVVCGAGQRDLESRIGFTFGNLLKRFCAILWVLIGLGCLGWYLGPTSPLSQPNSTIEQATLLADLRLSASGDPVTLSSDEANRVNQVDQRFADRLFGRVFRDLMGRLVPGLTGLAAAMVIAGAVSHCGTQMVVGSGLFATHLHRRYLSPDEESENSLGAARVCGPLLVIAALVLQMSFHSVGDVLRLFIKTPAIIGVSMWMGLIWTRWNTASVWVSTLTGTFVGVVCGFFPEQVERTFPGLADQMFEQTSAGRVMLDSWKIVVILGSTLVSGIFTTLMTDLQQDEQLEFFYRLIRTPVGENERDVNITNFQPSDDDELVPCFAFLGFQLPGPTRGGSIGFLLACLLVIAMIVGTKLIAMVI
jgi:Na+/proline symporter